MSAEEASQMLGEDHDVIAPRTLLQRRTFLGLPPEEQRRILAEQARAMQGEYASDPDRYIWQEGDLVDDER